jgi:hypothetical protein
MTPGSKPGNSFVINNLTENDFGFFGTEKMPDGNHKEDKGDSWIRCPVDIRIANSQAAVVNR